MPSGGRVAFGTDGISFDREDFFDEFWLPGCRSSAGRSHVPSDRLGAAPSCRGRERARALGSRTRAAASSPGKDADLLVLRLDSIFEAAERYAATDPARRIVDRADATNLEGVFVRGPCVLARRQLRRSSRPSRRSTRRLERGRRATVTAARQLQRRRRRGPEPELKISNCRLDRPRKTREHGAHTAADVLHEWLVPLEPRRRDYLWNERSSAAVVAAIHPFVAVRVAGRL